MLRHFLRLVSRRTATTKRRGGFSSEKQAYDFCRQIYNETNGPTPELRKAFEVYRQHAGAAPHGPLLDCHCAR